MPSGDCFVAALRAAIELYQTEDLDATEILIAHGLVVGQPGSRAAGVRYWHAWVEVKHSGGWAVLDRSNDREISLKRSAYYRAGQVNPRTQVWRYEVSEALDRVSLGVASDDRIWGTYGPWVPGWETMGEEHLIEDPAVEDERRARLEAWVNTNER